LIQRLEVAFDLSAIVTWTSCDLDLFEQDPLLRL
jgi:hypothetical protein